MAPNQRLAIVRRSYSLIEDLSNIAVMAPGNAANTPIQLELYGSADIRTSGKYRCLDQGRAIWGLENIGLI
jgi:hypothetical protein